MGELEGASRQLSPARNETSVGRSPGPLVPVGSLACDTKRQDDVLLGGQHREEVEELEDEADVLTPKFGEITVAEAVAPRQPASRNNDGLIWDCAAPLGG